jgi:hypothetical protein
VENGEQLSLRREAEAEGLAFKFILVDLQFGLELGQGLCGIVSSFHLVGLSDNFLILNEVNLLQAQGQL